MLGCVHCGVCAKILLGRSVFIFSPLPSSPIKPYQPFSPIEVRRAAAAAPPPPPAWPAAVGKEGEERIMTSESGGDGKRPVDEQAVANMYATMRSEINQLHSKINELEMEVSEHSLVIGAIEPLDPSRRCYRMIGGVLVERTIKEVLPAVKRNKEGLEEVIARMNDALERKKKELTEFEAKYKIRIRKSDEVKDESALKEGSAQGVLVGPAGGEN